MTDQPLSRQVQSAYARNAERLLPEYRATLANAVKILQMLETKKGEQ